jgi:hypothetical protein
VRCKMKLEKKTQTTSGRELSLNPVTGGSAENDAFFKYTPYGEISIGLVNATVADAMTVGKAYYVDFTEAP